MELISVSVPCVCGGSKDNILWNYLLVVCVGGCVGCGGVQPPGKVVNGGQGELVL